MTIVYSNTVMMEVATVVVSPDLSVNHASLGSSKSPHGSLPGVIRCGHEFLGAIRGVGTSKVSQGRNDDGAAAGGNGGLSRPLGHI